MAPSSAPESDSGIRDNHTRGSIGDFLQEKIQSGGEPQRHGAVYRRVRYAGAAPFDTRSALLRMLCGALSTNIALTSYYKRH